MSGGFTFGANQAFGSSQQGAVNPTTTAAGTQGFTFGAASSVFGSAAQTSSNATPGGFNFGGPTALGGMLSAPPAYGALTKPGLPVAASAAFGGSVAPKASSSTAASALPAFSFGMATSQAPASAGAGFGTSLPQTTTNSGFSFGGATPVGGGFSLGAAKTQVPASSGTSFAFGVSQAPASTGFTLGGGASASPGLTLGTAATKAPATTAFNLGLGTATPAATGFALGSGTTQPSGTTGFTLGGGTTQAPATTVFNLGGGGATPATTGFALGSGTTQPSGTTGFTLGGGATQAPAASGFAFGGGVPTQVPTSTGFTSSGVKATANTGLPLGSGALPSGGFTLGSGSGQGVSTGGLNLVGTTSTPSSTGPSLGTLSSAAPGGFSFGVSTKPAGALATVPDATTNQVGSTTLAPASTAFSFGAPAAQSAATGPKKDTPGGLGLGASLSAGAVTSKPASGLQLSAAASAPGGLSVSTTSAGQSQPASAPVSASVTAAATTATAPVTTVTTAAPTMTPMSYKELEDQINKWWVELEGQEKTFLEQATRVNAWDRILIQNGEKIAELNADVEQTKLEQQRLNHELDFIVAQQQELEEMLVPLEQAVEKLPSLNYQQHTDTEREQTYQMAENIDAQLKRMTEDLREVIDYLNNKPGNQETSDPMMQISKILNAHMASLQWVDQATVQLQKRAEETSKYADHMKREHERNFRLAFS